MPRYRSQVLVAIALFTTLAALVIAYLLGVAHGERVTYHRRFLEQMTIVEEILEGESEYSTLRIEEASSGYCYLSGELESRSRWEQLRTQLREEFGTRLATRMLSAVRVK